MCLYDRAFTDLMYLMFLDFYKANFCFEKAFQIYQLQYSQCVAQIKKNVSN